LPATGMLESQPSTLLQNNQEKTRRMFEASEQHSHEVIQNHIIKYLRVPEESYRREGYVWKPALCVSTKPGRSNLMCASIKAKDDVACSEALCALPNIIFLFRVSESE
jgi:hypothetical protein